MHVSLALDERLVVHVLRRREFAQVGRRHERPAFEMEAAQPVCRYGRRVRLLEEERRRLREHGIFGQRHIKHLALALVGEYGEDGDLALGIVLEGTLREGGNLRPLRQR